MAFRNRTLCIAQAKRKYVRHLSHRGDGYTIAPNSRALFAYSSFSPNMFALVQLAWSESLCSYSYSAVRKTFTLLGIFECGTMSLGVAGGGGVLEKRWLRGADGLDLITG